MTSEPVIHLSLHQARLIAEDVGKLIKDLDKLKKHLEFGLLEGLHDSEPKQTYDDN